MKIPPCEVFLFYSVLRGCGGGIPAWLMFGVFGEKCSLWAARL